MKAEIVCVGTELLLGDIVNTNAPYIARELAALGIGVYHQSVVGDNAGRLKQSLARALQESDCVITTGGLGPTYDDLTKETAAALFGMELEEDEESLERMTEMFQKIGRPMTENNRKQALLPRGAKILANHNGTAPGAILEKEGKRIILLPGPPREMIPMFRDQVVPYLRELSDRVFVSRNIHLFGIGESAVEQALRETMVAMQNPTIAPYAKDGEVLLRVTASAANGEEAGRLLDPVVRKICSRFEQYVYGVDVGSLQAAAVGALREKKLVLATAESCTGGLISKRITEIPGASEAFAYGVCTYANEAKERLLGVKAQTLAQYGAVSEQTAREMAAGVRRLSGADIGISTTGIAGPDGGTDQKPVGLVFVGVDSDKYSTVLRLTLGRGYCEEREYIRYVASSNALFLALQAARMHD